MWLTLGTLTDLKCAIAKAVKYLGTRAKMPLFDLSGNSEMVKSSPNGPKETASSTFSLLLK